MGVFMASVAFRRTDKANWSIVKPKIEEMFLGVDGLVSNLDEERDGYAIVSPYGEMGQFLADLTPKISRLTGNYAVMTVCVDSDFGMLELYHDGKLLEKSCIGEMYEELDEFDAISKPSLELWKPLLTNPQQVDALEESFFGETVFVEEQLRELSDLVGLPIFDDGLVFGDLE